jgi:hypothetical protein
MRDVDYTEIQATITSDYHNALFSQRGAKTFLTIYGQLAPMLPAHRLSAGMDRIGREL